MKFESPMLVVADINKSVQFYKELFGLEVVLDFGANKTLTGGLALQTLETYKEFIGKTIFLLAVITSKSILKRMISMRLL